MKNFMLVLVVLAFLLVACVPDFVPHEGGYTITLMNGEEKFLDYPLCESHYVGFSANKQMARCYNSDWETVYLAEVTSFTVEE